jgi:hypothetical protein
MEMSSAINSAILQLAKRAETNSREILRKTFVDFGNLSSAISTRDHQIIYGRRGTGKTHAFSYLAEKFKSQKDLAVYIDLRTVGSTGGIYYDSHIRVQERASRLLVDVLSRIYNDLFDEVVSNHIGSEYDQNHLIELLDVFHEQSSKVVVTGQTEVEVKNSRSSEDIEVAEATAIASLTPSLGGKLTGTNVSKSGEERRERENGIRDYSLNFGGVADALSRVLDYIRVPQMWLLLDEWSSVPVDLQPFLADFIKRCLFPLRKLSVKIAAIEQQSKFRASISGGVTIGIEVGADAAANLDLDDFMVFDSDAKRSAEFFSNLLYNHLRVIAEERNLTFPGSPAAVVSEIFTQTTAFQEFVRAAEGVPRDAINLIWMAAQKAGDSRLSVNHVRGAAKTWYLRDKLQAVSVDKHLQDLLHWIIDEVIGARKARAFLVPFGAVGTNEHLSRLFESRMIHVVKRGISSKDQPGRRFDAVALDYGCYVDLITTNREPQGLFPVTVASQSTGDGTEEIEEFPAVPQDDYRSIRRAILDVDLFLNRHS